MSTLRARPFVSAGGAQPLTRDLSCAGEHARDQARAPGHREYRAKGPCERFCSFSVCDTCKRTTVAESPYMHFAADSRFFAQCDTKKASCRLA